MTSQTFSPARISALMKHHAAMNLKSYLIAFGAAADVLLVILFADMYRQHSMDTHAFTGVTFPAVFIGGLIFTSMIFREIHHPLRSHAFLMLPASNAEKLTAYWLLSSVGYLTASITVLYLINIVLATAGYFILDVPIFAVNLFSISAMKFYGAYLFFHSMFLFGAVTFRNLNFLKTILAGITVAIITGLAALLALFVIYRNEAHPAGHCNISIITADLGCTALPCALVMGLAAVFLASAYYKLKEKQV